MAVDLSNLKREVVDNAKRRATEAAQQMTSDLKRTAPVDTAELQRKTGVEVTAATEQRITAVASIEVEYAEFVTMGTRPHIIRPRRPDGVLVFQSGGQTVFAKKVNHPGTTANPFFDNVVSRWGDYLQSAT